MQFFSHLLCYYHRWIVTNLRDKQQHVTINHIDVKQHTTIDCQDVRQQTTHNNQPPESTKPAGLLWVQSKMYNNYNIILSSIQICGHPRIDRMYVLWSKQIFISKKQKTGQSIYNNQPPAHQEIKPSSLLLWQCKYFYDKSKLIYHWHFKYILLLLKLEWEAWKSRYKTKGRTINTQQSTAGASREQAVFVIAVVM